MSWGPSSASISSSTTRHVDNCNDGKISCKIMGLRIYIHIYIILQFKYLDFGRPVKVDLVMYFRN